MTEEESISKMPEESYSSSNASRQRRKRKWDQPAEAIVSAAFHMPSVFPPSSIAAATGLTIPVVASPSIAVPTVLLPTTSASIPQVYQAPLAYQNAASIVHKMNQEATAKVVGLHLQPKIQDELIAREIVINDAESAIRYKLTKRQTQEEIQKCTGAVVITRGKYRPPSAVQDIEKPLYLHISAGAHLHDTAERIKAVDSAAALIEDIMRQGQHGHPASAAFLPIASTTNQETQPLSVSLFLGFDVDPSMNIAARIRGPNDQYINHIMNETGATVVLKGRGSGNADNVSGEESQPLHLYLSSNNLKSLEAAKLLAENLLDTISVECGATRVSTSKAYNAVPPPQQLLVGVRTSTGIEENKISDRIAAASDCLATTSTALPSSSVVAISPAVAVVSTAHSQATGPPGVVNCGQPPLTTANHCPPSFTGGTNYNGYGGIYPQATPLQQVALALIQPPTQALPVQVPSSDTTTKSPGAEKPQTGQRSHRRKFQELPTEAKGSKETEFLKPGNFSERQSSRSLLSMPSPKKFLPPSSNGMPPPPPKFLSRPPQGKMPPPPPPKFTSQPPKRENPQSNDKKVDDGPASEFLLKLAEYGDDDDDEGVNEKSHGSDLRSPSLSAKPFWAA